MAEKLDLDDLAARVVRIDKMASDDATPGRKSAYVKIGRPLLRRICEALEAAQQARGECSELESRATEAEATGKQGVSDEEDDSLLLCLSDLEHSAIYDNSAEMPRCVRAVTKRMRALLSRPAQSATVDVAAGVPTFECKHVRVKQMSDGKIMVTMITDAFEGAANYAVQPINPAAVRAAPTPTAPDDVARDAERYRWLQRQRVHVWHEVAGLRMNHTDDFIDAAIAASKDPT